MKKIILLLIALTMMLIVACQSDYDYPDVNAEQHYPQYDAADMQPEPTPELQPTPEPEPTPEPQPIPEYILGLSELHIAMLYDFDYLVRTMEETFHYIGVAERKFGIDFDALVYDVREQIINYPYSMQEFAEELGIAPEDMPPMDEQVLWSIIENDFLMPFIEAYGDSAPPFAHIGSVGFYSYFSPYRIVPGGSNESRTFYTQQRELFLSLPDENLAFFQFLFRFIPGSVEYSLFYDDPRGRETDAITLEILEEGRIAYFGVTCFLTDMVEHIPKLEEFYEYIQNYEHLIIDVRENMGGRINAPQQFIMNPLWYDRDDMPNAPLFVFFQGEGAERRFEIEAMRRRVIEVFNWQTETLYIHPIEEILENASLNLRNEDDFRNLTYGYVINTSFENMQGRNIRNAPENFPFGGQIWLLIGEQTYSSATLFAFHAKHMDFATVVGETTAGGMSAFATLTVILPNSGIIVQWDSDYITDQYGRSLVEFPPGPQYFNREGLDALETVLQMIAEME